MNLQYFINPIFPLQYCSLKKTHRCLQAEYDSLKLNLLEVTTQNKELKLELDDRTGRDKWLSNIGTVADREVLRQRLYERDEKIASLADLLEEQEMSIVALTSQLHWVTSSVASKEVSSTYSESTFSSRTETET